jgi:hypothetical protein
MVARGWSEAKRRAYAIADNRLPLSAGWDEAMLALELSALSADEFDLGLLGFEPVELDEYLNGVVDPLGDTDSPYTAKVEVPIYVPTGPRPEIGQLYSDQHTQELMAEILAADVADADKAFLLKAAQRHTVFDYHQVAEYYAHAEPALQRLMEASALVIIDFDQAIERGFVKLTEELRAQRSEEHGEPIDADAA